ncbi:MAG: hypothetical protein AB9835_07985 [Eubacteriales bacterium]
MDITIRRAAALITVFILALSLPLYAQAAGQPEAKVSGDYLCYTVDIKKPAGDTLSFAFTRLKKLDYIIQPGDTLEYDVLIISDSPGLGAMDGEIKGLGRSIRDNGFVDQNAQGIHPGMDLRSYALGKWWHRSINIALDETSAPDVSNVTVGMTLTELQLAIHPDSADYSELEAVVCYDNIVITNGGEEKLVIFRDAADFDPSHVATSNKKNITDAQVAVKALSAEEAAVLEREWQSELDAAFEAEQEKLAKKLEGKAAREQSALNGGVEYSTSEDKTEQDNNSASAENSSQGDTNILGSYSMVFIVSIAAGAIILTGVVIFIVNKRK